MRGINYNDLTLSKTKLDEYSTNVYEETNDVTQGFTELTNSYKGTDLTFLTDNLKYEIEQLEKVKDNNNNYSITIQEVLKSYQSENDRLRETISNVSPQRDL